MTRKQTNANRLALGGAAAGALALLIGYRLVSARKGAEDTAERERTTYPPLDTPKPVAEALWIVDSGPITAMGIRLPVRMSIIRLANGDLLLHSPTQFSADLARKVEALGPVRHLVAPNVAHWTFLSDWQRHYPDARTWAAPGLRDRPQVRRSGLRFDADLGEQAPDEWAGEIDQGVVPGGAGFREVYFFHRPSGTLLLTDLIENLEPAKLPPLARALMRLSAGTEGTTARYLRMALRRDRDRAAGAVRQMIAHKPERVILAHGQWFQDRGTERLKEAFAWLL